MLAEDRDPVDVLAEEFADLLRRGEHPSVSDYAAAHPQHADELKELLPAVAQMEMLKRFRTPNATTRSLPDRLGDFRIIRELGRGGMGVVFEAVQESLGRPVALKVLARHAQLDATRRERFVREAQAAAKLHHTNIVPVFGVGEQDGLPYYVMQLIPGYGLHSLVRHWRRQCGKEPLLLEETRAVTPGTKPADTPQPLVLAEKELEGPQHGDWRAIAEIGRQAADALHYAHKQGVLHRDVKPANLILNGETVWVTDFGLAKLMNADGLTATGDILGTLQYLAPECLAGLADSRSDVYGLGATLYELLTLQSPYETDTPARLIKQITDSDPIPPRQLNPAIPRDLETIVLKAMSREPASRYASARELARDLEAFLEDRPIKARRTSAVSRTWRWCRRNPTVAGLAATTTAAVLLAAVTGWASYVRAEERRAEAVRLQRAAETAKADADRATAEAADLANKLEASLRLSLETFEKVFEAASGNGQPGFGLPIPMPGMRGPDRGPPGGAERLPNPGGPAPGGPMLDQASDKAAILEAILEFYDKFAQQSKPTPRLQLEAAKASRRVCEANVWMRRPDKAISAARRAGALLESLHAKFPKDEATRIELVTLYLIAPEEAFSQERGYAHRRATELAAGNPWLAGSVQFRIGLTYQQHESRDAAEACFATAVRNFSAPGVVLPPQGHMELAMARYHLAWAQSQNNRHVESRRTLEELIADLTPFAERPHERDGPPRFQPARQLLAEAYTQLAHLCAKLNDTKAAELASKHGAQYANFGGAGGGPGGGFGGRPGFGGFGGSAFGGPWHGGKKDGPPKKDGPSKKN